MSRESALIIGSGGRENQLGLSIKNSVDELYFAPGNAGTADIGENLNFGPNNHDKIANFVTKENINLTIVGPEQPLVDGLVNQLQERGHATFGPNKIAARLEGYKAHAIGFMRDFDIPHPKTFVANNPSSRTLAMQRIDMLGAADLVLKANGLAGGKGVVLPKTASEAKATLIGMYSGELYDGAGKDCVIIQERLHGPEVSVLVICDGENYVTLPLSQDHKRLKDNDRGPNTGGMGAYSPVPDSIISRSQQEKINEIVEKYIYGTKARNMDYKGVLYIGLMLAEEYGGDPVVMEYNVRFGDPEAQAVLPLMQRAGVDTYDLLRSSAEGNLRTDLIPKIGGAALTVCLAAEYYPEAPVKGDEIYGLQADYPNVIVQHGGTKKDSDKTVTNGGRVMYVTGLGKTIDEAALYAYSAIGEDGIHFRGAQYRKDIGRQARKHF